MGLTIAEPNLFAYVGDNPALFADSKGLYRIDPSCDCSGTPLTNVPRTIAQSCKYIKKPKCAELARRYSLVPFQNSGRAKPLDQCLRDRCSADENGSGPQIICSKANDPCGFTNPFTGDITLFRGSAQANCPRLKQAPGQPPVGYRDYVQTLFHETIHSCGWGPFHGNEFNELSEVCTGW